MGEILEGLDGLICIADDVGVCGEQLRNTMLMERDAEKWLVFNNNKCAIKQYNIPFFGNIYRIDDIKPNPTKIDVKKRCQHPKVKTIYNDV